MITWHKDHEKCKLITGYQSITVNQELEIVRVRVKVEKILYAFIIGEFNNWEKLDAYRLDWKVDTNDGSLYMMADINFMNKLHEGIHEYSYRLIDTDGNEAIFSSASDKFIPFSFSWNPIKRDILLKSSQNIVTVGNNIEFIATKKIGNNQQEIIDVSWHCKPHIHGVQLENDTLYIDKSIKHLQNIEIFCRDPITHHEVSRVFNVISTPAERKIKIHYFRNDGNYKSYDFIWEIWGFNNGEKTGKVIDFIYQTDFGMMAEVDCDFIIVRKRTFGDGWQNEWAEQTAAFTIEQNNDNYYVVDGMPEIYTELKQVILASNPRIESALLDSKNKIIANLSSIPPIGTKFYLHINQQRCTQITTIIKDNSQQVIFLDLPKTLQAHDLVSIHASDTFAPRKVVMRNFLDEIYYNGNDLGCHFHNGKISLKLWAPTAKQVELLIYNDYQQDINAPDHCLMMEHDITSGVHNIKISADEFTNSAYIYRLYFDDLDINGQYIKKITHAVDPYAFGLNINGKKAVMINLNSHENTPSNWDKDIRPNLESPQDAIIYEMHIRDFSNHSSSQINTLHRGKFLGAVESSSIENPQGHFIKTGLDSLTELGVTHVHLLPIFDFSSVDESDNNDPENRNWGYDPQNYNAPEGSYATNPFNPHSRILELRMMVKQFHNHGLRVVMDMVYNHMTETTNMDNIVPRYYFRTDEYGKFTNGSGCGNEMATERPMVRKFILDSILHWIQNYHIDGTRFDLMELMDFDTMQMIEKLVHKEDPSLLVYGEPWKGGNSPLWNGTYRGRQKNNQFAIFNDIFRDATRGNNSPSYGFVNGGQHNPLNLWHVIEGLKGSISGMTAHANESINYVDAHDNYTLWDQIEKSQNSSLKNGNYRQNLSINLFENQLIRQNALAIGIILTAQGIPFLHSGIEMLRTKQGDHNSYKSNDDINCINWHDKVNYYQFFQYVHGLITLRKMHPAFRMENPQMINTSLLIKPAYDNDRSGVIISHFKDHANGDIWRNIIVIYNATAIDDYDINPLLPPLEADKSWVVVVNHEEAGIRPIGVYNAGNLPPLKSFSICVLHDS